MDGLRQPVAVPSVENIHADDDVEGGCFEIEQQ